VKDFRSDLDWTTVKESERPLIGTTEAEKISKIDLGFCILIKIEKKWVDSGHHYTVHYATYSKPNQDVKP